MPPSLTQLEQEKGDLLRAFSELGDLRPGSITGIVRRCGKPSCHCAQPNDPGHGPTLRLSYKVQGKTISEALPTPIALRKAEQEIAEFRKYQQLSHAFVQVNEQLCRLRPVEETLTPQKKNGGSDPARSRPRSKPPASGCLCRSSQDRPNGSGGHRDARAWIYAPRRSRDSRPSAVDTLVGSKSDSLPLWSFGALS